MAGLDFKRATDLFMASEEELALALGVQAGDIRAFRTSPERVPPELMRKLGRVLVERGIGMIRVGEILQET